VHLKVFGLVRHYGLLLLVTIRAGGLVACPDVVSGRWRLSGHLVLVADRRKDAKHFAHARHELDAARHAVRARDLVVDQRAPLQIGVHLLFI
jgi:hypothetical protein